MKKGIISFSLFILLLSNAVFGDELILKQKDSVNDNETNLTEQLEADKYFIPIIKDKKLCYIDSTGKILLDTERKLDPESIKIHFENKTSDVKMPPTNYRFSEGITTIEEKNLLKTQLGDRLIGINYKGETIFQGYFNWIGDCKEGLLQVKMKKRAFFVFWDYKYGYLNKNGTIQIEPQFDYVGPFSEDLARVQIKKKFGFIDKKGNFQIEPQFDQAGDFKEGLAAISLDGKFGYINKQGSVVIEPQFQKAWAFDEGLARVCVDDKMGFINKDGEWIIDPKFDFAANFSQNLSCVKYNDKTGYIDKQGEFVLEPTYKTGASFNNGLAPVLNEIGWVYINQKDEIILNDNYDVAYPFYNGIAIVIKKDKAYYINTSGKIISKIYSK